MMDPKDINQDPVREKLPEDPNKASNGDFQTMQNQRNWENWNKNIDELTLTSKFEGGNPNP